MKRPLATVVFAAAAAVASAEISYCNKGTPKEHSHFYSHDIPDAGGVIIEAKGPDGYLCQTNDHPLVSWSKRINGDSVEVVYAIDIVPVEKKKAKLYLKWIEADEVEGDSIEMDFGEDWKEQANAVLRLGNVKAVAADFVNEKENMWRHFSVIPAEHGKLVTVDFSVRAESAKAAERLVSNGLPEIGKAFGDFELANPFGQHGREGSSTGWFVTPSNIVTCAHCAESWSKNWFVNEKGRKVPLEIVARDAESDIALLAVADPSDANASFLPVAPRPPRLGEQVWTLGYPLTTHFDETVKYGEGAVTARNGRRGSKTQFTVSAPIRPGASGGPVFNSSGCVCGIMAATFNSQALLKANGLISPESNWAVRGELIYAFLKENGVPMVSEPLLPSVRPDAVEEAAKAVVLLHSKPR